MTEWVYPPQPAIVHRPFAAFVLRRALRALLAALVLVLLAGVVIANDDGYRAMLDQQESVAQMKACTEFLEQARTQGHPAAVHFPNEAFAQACPWYFLRH